MSIVLQRPPHPLPADHRQRALLVVVSILTTLVLFAASAHGAQIGDLKGVEVGPGTNNEVTITEQAEAQDQLFISFRAKAGWHFTTKTDCNDSANLGWKRYHDHAFQVVLRDDLAIKTFHTARFNGKMAPDDKAGPGTGSIKPDYPWDIDGKFKLLYDHEGVGSDFKRTKPGSLVSKKPEAPATDSGVATVNDETGQFVGSFGGYVGQHLGDVAAHPGTAKSIDLQEKGDNHEIIDCPDGDKVKVIKVYLGVDDAGKIGGLPNPDPDTIQINSFSVDAELAQAQTKLATATTAKDLADAAVTKLKAEIATAETEVARLKATVEAAIVKVVATLQRDVTAKEAALNRALAAEKKAKDDFDQIVKNGAPPNSARYRKAKTDYDNAVIARSTAQTQLDNAKKKLATARVAAETDAKVVAAREALTAAETALHTKQTALIAAEATALTAAKAVSDALAEVKKYQRQQADWITVRDGTLIHENGHRRILGAHIDKMTTMLNTLRVWGYALKEARAKSIAEIEFKKIRTQHVLTIRQMNLEMQGEGTGYDGVTKHGIEQDKWTTWPDGTYP